MNDQAEYPIEKRFEVAIHFIQDAITGGGKVFVHCVRGISPSPAIVII